MEKKQRRVTCSDVARVSGVSRATVSYVLNNDPKQTISVETRKRVLNAAKELGYQPLAAARTLRIGHSNLVLAVVSFEQIDPHIAGDLKYIEDGLAKHGYTLIWHVGTHNLPDLRHPSSNVTPAVILSFADNNDPSVAAFLEKFNAPILSMSITDFGKSVGTTQATYLIQHGYQSIVYATTERRDIQRLSQNRLEGVRQACAEFDVMPPFEQIIPSTHDDCKEAIKKLLTHQSPPFGICCYNDEVAFSVISALTENGIKIPDSVAVIGCDDLPLAQFSIPSLTTIAFKNYQFLDQTIENILATSRGEPVKQSISISPSVVIRESA